MEAKIIDTVFQFFNDGKREGTPMGVDLGNQPCPAPAIRHITRWAQPLAHAEKKSMPLSVD